jgi:hypothetical protein
VADAEKESNEPTVPANEDGAAGPANALLREYTARLNGVTSECARLLAASLRPATEPAAATALGYDATDRLIQLLLPPARTLAQMVSQDLLRLPRTEFRTVELRLRLAEFEGAIFACERAQVALKQNPPPRK